MCEVPCPDIMSGDDIVYTLLKYWEIRGTNRDKAKGIICKPMPAAWHDYHAVFEIEDDERREFYERTVADRKPYFMRYIYPSLMREYRKYANIADRKSVCEFGISIDELLAIPNDELTERQQEFLHYYWAKAPVGASDCVMNRICRRFEKEFDGCLSRLNANSEFDYTIMKSEYKYSKSRYYAVKKLRDEYNDRLKVVTRKSATERQNKSTIMDTRSKIARLNENFAKQCAEVCVCESELCEILLDLCYRKANTKSLIWGICSSEIVRNLLAKHDGIISYPTKDANGDFEYKGERYSLATKRIEVD